MAKAHALLIHAQPLVLPDDLVQPRITPPPPGDCTSALRIPGLPDVRSFYYTAMEGRVAAGTPGAPLPGAAWTSAAVRLANHSSILARYSGKRSMQPVSISTQCS